MMTPTRTAVALLTIACLSGVSAARENVELGPAAEASSTPVAVKARLTVSGAVRGERAADDEATPVEIDARLEYAQTGTRRPGGGTVIVRRAESRAANGDRGDDRLFLAEPSPNGARVTAVAGPLPRADVDRLEWAADPLDLAGLLPGDPVREGATWRLADSAAARLMRLDSTSLVEVTAILTDLTSKHARIRFAGPLHGRNDGATTEIDLRGVALFDRAAGRFSQVNLAWKEARKLGAATPALTATAKLNVVIAPLAADRRFTSVDLSRAAAATPDARLLIEAPDHTWTLLAPRDWFVVGATARAVTLRQVADQDGGRAELTVVARPGKALPSDEFRREVEYTLGDGLRAVGASTTGVTSGGLQRLTLASAGQVEGAPTTWWHTQLVGPGGVVSAATTAPRSEDTTEDPADELLDSLRLRGGNAETATAPAAAAAVRR